MSQGSLKWSVVALASVLPLGAMSQADNSQGSAPVPVFVETMVVGDAEARQSRQFFAQVAALETVTMSFEVGGYLSELEAREGQVIERGTQLAQLDLAPFERAVQRAELALAQAERDYERAQMLAARSVTSDVQARDAETARDLAEVALREARDALSDAKLSAPFDGLIAERIATTFSTIEPGQPIVRLHNMSEMRVEFDLPERLLSLVGDPASVTFTGRLTGDNDGIPLEFREFQVETGQIGQSYRISLAATDQPPGQLLPGRTMVVEASIAATRGAVVVPATAIKTAPDGRQMVVVIDGSGDTLTARDLEVEVTSEDGTRFQVSGLDPATEIVSIGAHLIDDGQSVARFSGLTVEGL